MSKEQSCRSSRTRTDDLLNPNQVCYQLHHAPKNAPISLGASVFWMLVIKQPSHSHSCCQLSDFRKCLHPLYLSTFKTKRTRNLLNIKWMRRESNPRHVQFSSGSHQHLFVWPAGLEPAKETSTYPKRLRGWLSYGFLVSVSYFSTRLFRDFPHRRGRLIPV